MEGMETVPLREKVATAILATHKDWCQEDIEAGIADDVWHGYADAALAALGLDDLDAAMERTWQRIDADLDLPYLSRDEVRVAVLALLATEGGDGAND